VLTNPAECTTELTLVRVVAAERGMCED
jgi:hypothetical protein